MKVWSALAVKQLTRVGDMNTREAMRLIAYWQGRLPIENQKWRPVLSAVLRHAPERKRITSRLIATDRLLRLIYGETETRPKVLPGVQIAVVDYIGDSAREMDLLKPDAVPKDVPVRILDAQAKRLANQLKTKTKRKSNWGWLLVIAIAISAKKKRR